jgi:hypothetical protein
MTFPWNPHRRAKVAIFDRSNLISLNENEHFIDLLFTHDLPSARAEMEKFAGTICATLSQILSVMNSNLHG